MNLLKILFLSIFTLSLQANSEVLASFNGEKLTLQEFSQMIKKPNLTKSEMLQNKSGYTNIINKVIDEKLLSQYVLQNNLISDAMVRDELKAIELKTIYNEYYKHLAKNTTVTNEEMATFYTQNKSEMMTPKEYRVFLIPFKENSIYANDMLEDAKNAKDKNDFFLKNNGIEKVITKSFFPDEKSFEAFSKIKVGAVCDTLIPIGNQYFLFYMMYIQEPKAVSFEEGKQKIYNFLHATKIQNQINSLVAKLKQTAKITYDNNGFPTINNFAWNYNLLVSFLGNGAKKYTTIQNEKKILSDIESITFIYQDAINSIFKDSRELQAFLENTKQALKVNKWKNGIFEKQNDSFETKVSYIAKTQRLTLDEAKLYVYGHKNDVGLSSDELIKWATLEEFDRIAQSLRKKANVQIFLDTEYSAQRTTVAQPLKAQSTEEIIAECASMGEKITQNEKSRNFDDNLFEKFHTLCESRSFEKTAAKSACIRNYKDMSIKEKKAAVKENYFCKNYF